MRAGFLLHGILNAYWELLPFELPSAPDHQQGWRPAHEQGRDIIDLTALASTNINDFGDLNIEVAGSNSIIHFDASNDLTIARVMDLTAGDFWFA